MPPVEENDANRVSYLRCPVGVGSDTRMTHLIDCEDHACAQRRRVRSHENLAGRYLSSKALKGYLYRQPRAHCFRQKKKCSTGFGRLFVANGVTMGSKRSYHACVSFWLLGLGWVLAQPPLQSSTCSVCTDGSSPLETTDLLGESLFGSGVSCASLVSNASSLVGFTQNCSVLQLKALQGGCCSNSTGSLCTLCPGGVVDLSFPLRSVPSPPGHASGITCNDLILNDTIQTWFLTDFVGLAGVCENTLLRQSAGYCGCSTALNSCDLCSGKELLSDQTFNLTRFACSDIAYNFSLSPSGQCQQETNSRMVGFDSAALCCANVSVPDQCGLCTVRQHLVPTRAVTTELYGEITCADLQGAASLATSNTICQTLQQQSGGFCCVDLVNVSSCELLCPNGMAPQDPFKTDPVTGYSCQSLAEEYAKLPSDQCDTAAAAIGFDAVAFCCAGVAPQNECPICSNDQELLYPERVLFNYKEQSCANLTASLQYAVGNSCQDIIDQSFAVQNCQCRPRILPTPPPEGVPNSVMGGGSGSSSLRETRKWFASTFLLGAFLLCWSSSL